MNSSQDQLKTGKRPTPQQIRLFKAGEILFEEGSVGKELYILQDGKVGVYKDTAEGRIELAVIEKGSMIGEMSLLDDLPRSATVKAIEDTRVLVINQAVFQTVFQTIPVWLQSIIKIVVSRLRDANKRVDQSALRDKLRGIVSLILLLLPSNKSEINNHLALDYNLVLVEGFYVSRLRKKEIQKILEELVKRKIIQIDPQGNGGSGLIIIKDLEVLRLYDEYLLLKSQKQTFKECAISDQAIAFLSNIAYIAQKSGQETDDGTTLMKSALVEDLSEGSLDQLDANLLDLRRKNLISIYPSDSDSAIVFSKETLSRIKKIKEWLPSFEAEVA